MNNRSYPSDLSDAQWRVIEGLIPPAKQGGRHRSVNMRHVLNAILYVVRSGCAWRMLPHDYPPWSTAYDYFRKFKLSGVWWAIHDALRDQVRKRDKRQTSPSAAIIDSQSVKTTEKGGSGGMMQARRSMAANVISSSIPLD
jgi:putative transposase